MYLALSYVVALGIATLRWQNEGAQTSLLEDERPCGAGTSCPTEAPLSLRPTSLTTPRHVSEAILDQSVPAMLATLEKPS